MDDIPSLPVAVSSTHTHTLQQRLHHSSEERERFLSRTQLNDAGKKREAQLYKDELTMIIRDSLRGQENDVRTLRRNWMEYDVCAQIRNLEDSITKIYSPTSHQHPAIIESDKTLVRYLYKNNDGAITSSMFGILSGAVIAVPPALLSGNALSAFLILASSTILGTYGGVKYWQKNGPQKLLTKHRQSTQQNFHNYITGQYGVPLLGSILTLENAIASWEDTLKGLHDTAKEKTTAPPYRLQLETYLEFEAQSSIQWMEREKGYLASAKRMAEDFL